MLLLGRRRSLVPPLPKVRHLHRDESPIAVLGQCFYNLASAIVRDSLERERTDTYRRVNVIHQKFVVILVCKKPADIVMRVRNNIGDNLWRRAIRSVPRYRQRSEEEKKKATHPIEPPPSAQSRTHLICPGRAEPRRRSIAAHACYRSTPPVWRRSEYGARNLTVDSDRLRLLAWRDRNQ